RSEKPPEPRGVGLDCPGSWWRQPPFQDRATSDQSCDDRSGSTADPILWGRSCSAVGGRSTTRCVSDRQRHFDAVTAHLVASGSGTLSIPGFQNGRTPRNRVHTVAAPHGDTRRDEIP